MTPSKKAAARWSAHDQRMKEAGARAALVDLVVELRRGTHIGMTWDDCVDEIERRTKT